jgi:hypothetical protein
MSLLALASGGKLDMSSLRVDESNPFDIDLLAIAREDVEVKPDDVPLFDPSNIITGEPVYLRKKFCYVGYASTTYSVDQAVSIIDYIGHKTQSEDFLPYAITLLEGGEMISIAEDNGEFSCGEVVGNCLKKIEGLNILVCVSRRVEGCFVSDILQGQKTRAVRDAATNALKSLIQKVMNPSLGASYQLNAADDYSSVADIIESIDFRPSFAPKPF